MAIVRNSKVWEKGVLDGPEMEASQSFKGIRFNCTWRNENGENQHKWFHISELTEKRPTAADIDNNVDKETKV